MMKLRKIVQVAGILAFAACATQTLCQADMLPYNGDQRSPADQRRGWSAPKKESEAHTKKSKDEVADKKTKKKIDVKKTSNE